MAANEERLGVCKGMGGEHPHVKCGNKSWRPIEKPAPAAGSCEGRTGPDMDLHTRVKVLLDTIRNVEVPDRFVPREWVITKLEEILDGGTLLRTEIIRQVKGATPAKLVPLQSERLAEAGQPGEVPEKPAAEPAAPVVCVGCELGIPFSSPGMHRASLADPEYGETPCTAPQKPTEKPAPETEPSAVWENVNELLAKIGHAPGCESGCFCDCIFGTLRAEIAQVKRTLDVSAIVPHVVTLRQKLSEAHEAGWNEAIGAAARRIKEIMKHSPE